MSSPSQDTARPIVVSDSRLRPSLTIEHETTTTDGEIEEDGTAIGPATTVTRVVLEDPPAALTEMVFERVLRYALCEGDEGGPLGGVT